MEGKNIFVRAGRIWPQSRFSCRVPSFGRAGSIYECVTFGPLETTIMGKDGFETVRPTHPYLSFSPPDPDAHGIFIPVHTRCALIQIPPFFSRSIGHHLLSVPKQDHTPFPVSGSVSGNFPRQHGALPLCPRSKLRCMLISPTVTRRSVSYLCLLLLLISFSIGDLADHVVCHSVSFHTCVQLVGSHTVSDMVRVSMGSPADWM